jgi:hypothetical protein
VQRFDRPLSRWQRTFASLQYLGLMVASTVSLWHADAMPYVDAALYCAALCAAVWATGCFLQGRFSALGALAVQAAGLAMLGGLGLLA